jgi:hypothetical protein
VAEAGSPKPGFGRWDPNCEWPPHPRRLLEPDVVFDSMVPTYLARLNKIQMLRTAFADRAHIPGKVRGEISGLGRGYAGVTELVIPDPFAEIHPLTREQAIDARKRQIGWHGMTVIDAEPSKDRGEAEALALAAAHTGWVIVSQDSNAMSNAKISRIPPFAAPDVLLVFAVQGLCLATNAWKIYQAMLGLDPEPMRPSRFWPDDANGEAAFMAYAVELGCKV